MHIRIDPELAKLAPPLAMQDFENLRASIEDRGQDTPVMVAEDGTLLDGHHRYKILGDKCEVKVIKGLSTPEDREAFVIREAWSHRNMSPEQKRELADKA